MTRRTVDALLAEARAKLTRVLAADIADALARGAVVVDIRPAEQRDRDGTIPGSIVIDRNVLEWRLDARSPHRIPEVDGDDREIIIVCDEGYASSLAAATLQDLGQHRATDLIGGFQAWRAAGLPVVAAGS